jgi:hypothetical protein
MEDLIDEGQQTNLRFHYNLKTLSNVVIGSTAIALVLLIVRVILLMPLASYLHKAQEGTMSFTELSDVATRIDILQIIIALFAVVGAITFFMWLYRAYYNLEVVKVKGLSVTAGWAVGWFFIPFANLYYIVVVLNDLMRGTKHLKNQEPMTKDIIYTPVPMLGLALLLLSIASSVMSNVGLTSLESNPSANLDNVCLFEILSDVFDVLNAAVVVYLVYWVSKTQTEIAEAGINK